MSTENLRNNRLQELSGSDYEIADGQPDIRGWDVENESGETIGKVKELLFDETSRKVRYIITKLDLEDSNLDGRKVLVPIGIATLHKEDDDVVLPGVTLAQLQSLPEYDKDNFSPETEHSIRNIFGGVGGAVAGAALAPGSRNDDSFYDHDHFNEDNLYKNRNNNQTIPVIEEELQVGKREVNTGGIRLKSRIVENEVHEDVNLREEKVNVVRTPVDRVANESDIREESIQLTETAEVPVVSKEAVVVEEVSLSKEVNERNETISDTVKKTEIDIEETGKENYRNL
jgi:uncharacterized protein (TIGR02271 family)